jgi:hypothetical protein
MKLNILKIRQNAALSLRIWFESGVKQGRALIRTWREANPDVSGGVIPDETSTTFAGIFGSLKSSISVPVREFL